MLEFELVNPLPTNLITFRMGSFRVLRWGLSFFGLSFLRFFSCLLLTEDVEETDTDGLASFLSRSTGRLSSGVRAKVVGNK